MLDSRAASKRPVSDASGRVGVLAGVWVANRGCTGSLGAAQRSVGQSSTLGNVLDATGWSPSFAAGAGGAISTLGDLHRWAVAMGTGELLKRSTQRQRLIPNPASVGGGRAYLFALGLDHGWLTHTGEIPGYNTVVAYLPSLKATIVVITNSDISNATAVSPAPATFKALARVVAPGNVPTG